MMRKYWLTNGIAALLISAPQVYGAEGNEGDLGNLGGISTGYITIELVITEDITAGFLKTNLDDPDSALNELLSTELVNSITSEKDTTVPLCVMSSGGGYFEVTSFDVPATNTFNDEFSNTRPVEIGFGEDALSSIKYQSVTDDCNLATAIPVTINLNESNSGQVAGKINGRLNLLVKSE